jgi:uncharacterized protein YfaP (DUF2135 family)
MMVITWNTDNTDIDLHVKEPSGEECYYKNPSTKIGGRLTRDVTRGFGPEMYTLQDAPEGVYNVTALNYASDRNRTSVRTKVYTTIFEHWGTDQEKMRRATVALTEGKESKQLMKVVL